MANGSFSPSVNKAVMISLFVIFLGVVLVLSWIAVPTPFFELIERSVPVMIIVIVLVVVTIADASKISRFIGAGFFLAMFAMFTFMTGSMLWGVWYLFLGSSMLIDAVISSIGCKSPMESNASESFLTVLLLIVVAFSVGFFFEVINEHVLHVWNIMSLDGFYPMIEVAGVNLIIPFTWSMVGMLLFESMLACLVAVRYATRGKERACILR